MIPTHAIILAGGRGTRLSTEVPGIPKVLAPVNGKPFLHFVIQNCRSVGITKFTFALGYQHQLVEDYLKQNFSELDIRIVVERSALGTGGAIKAVLKQLTENSLAVFNGDTIFRIRLDSLAAFHHMSGAECTIALKSMVSVSRYGEVKLNKDYSIASFSEKGSDGEGLINGGVYIINKRLFEENNNPEIFSFEDDYLGVRYKERRIYGVKQSGYFIDIGVPDDYKKVQEELKDEL